MRTVIQRFVEEAVMEKRTMRSGEVAEALGLSNATIQAYARKGRIPARTTPGGQYRFDLDEVRMVLDPPLLETRTDLVDLFSTSVAVSDLTPFRTSDTDDATMHRMRIRAVRPTRAVAANTDIESPRAGADELTSLIEASGAAAMVVLRREPVDA